MDSYVFAITLIAIALIGGFFWFSRRASHSTNSNDNLKLVMLGAPCSGKSTQSEKLVEDFPIVAINAGDLLRDAVLKESTLGMLKRHVPFFSSLSGLQAKKLMEEGKLIPDALMIELFSLATKAAQTQYKGWVIKGFPRTVAQARAFIESGFRPDAIIELTVLDDELLSRVEERRFDPNTKKVYHLTRNPPPTELLPTLMKRPDNKDSLGKRLAIYHQQIKGVIDYFESIGIPVLRVDGGQPIPVVHRSMQGLVAAVIG